MMTRKEKIELLKGLSTGKISIDSFERSIRPSYSILFESEIGIEDSETGRIFKSDLSDMPEYAREYFRVILPVKK